MSASAMQHVQETFLALGDEFLIQYFLCADRRFRDNQMLSRLFSMGHSLELYLKGALVSHAGVLPTGHDISTLILKFDPSLALSQEELAAGRALFAPDVANFDIGLQMKHEEAMELYQAQYFLRDLKYYLDLGRRVIYPVRISLKAVNWRYLELVKRLRLSMPYRNPRQDEVVVRLVGQLGFEMNPALKVVGTLEVARAKKVTPELAGVTLFFVRAAWLGSTRDGSEQRDRVGVRGGDRHRVAIERGAGERVVRWGHLHRERVADGDGQAAHAQRLRCRAGDRGAVLEPLIGEGVRAAVRVA
jgi:hypothetical protein